MTDKPLRWWLVPFLFGNREIDSVWIKAKTSAEAKRIAHGYFVDRGYKTRPGYSIGKPFLPQP